MKAMTRCKSLDMSGLAAQEKHGKRQDMSSQMRAVNDDPPIIWGDQDTGLDLRDLYDAHMDGVRLNTSCRKPVLHFIVRLPPEVLDGDGVGLFVGTREDRQTEMLRQAVEFIQSSHGGDAVFAARLDRDEAGQTIVDVFAAPKYAKRTKRTKPGEAVPVWSSPTKYGKLLAIKHEDEIRRRHPGAKDGKLTNPRMVGIGLNADFRAYIEQTNGVELDRKIEKTSSTPDRLEIEAYKQVQAERDAASKDIDDTQAELDAVREDLGLELRALAKSIVDRAAAQDDLQAMQDEAKRAADAAKVVAADTAKAIDRLADLDRDIAEATRHVGRVTREADMIVNRLRTAAMSIAEAIGIALPDRLYDMLDVIDEVVDRIKAEPVVDSLKAEPGPDVMDPFNTDGPSMGM